MAWVNALARRENAENPGERGSVEASRDGVSRSSIGAGCRTSARLQDQNGRLVLHPCPGPADGLGPGFIAGRIA
ncbi:hypothetical protein J3D45_000871 [Microbacterium foliorum]|uniref:hypothetical protein n=1 Tax=Microbacterium foliorum TaxID=104336 RepID=UPI00209FC7E3|nr:hypothetical protein [Microbacterium foliorum]MCP1428373.1 hypothetical protein [Microbacterium foliorum]